MQFVGRVLFLSVLFVILCGCTETGGPNYEPIYLNETNVNVSILYGVFDIDYDNVDTVVVNPADSAYCVPRGYFPLLNENGLIGMDSTPYDVLLVFSVSPQRCLLFKGKEYREDDIRSFSSYENIGRCDFCVTRGEYVTYGMLYRITEDMLKEAVPCD